MILAFFSVVHYYAEENYLPLRIPKPRTRSIFTKKRTRFAPSQNKEPRRSDCRRWEKLCRDSMPTRISKVSCNGSFVKRLETNAILLIGRWIIENMTISLEYCRYCHIMLAGNLRKGIMVVRAWDWHYLRYLPLFTLQGDKKSPHWGHKVSGERG
jgi:hypothetical protein